jgi:tyrosine-protein kinase Etk/Wzc
VRAYALQLRCGRRVKQDREFMNSDSQILSREETQAGDRMHQPASSSTNLNADPSMDFLLVLAARKRLILGSVIIATCLGVAVALLLKPTYTATATIMPPQAAQSSLSALMGQMGALADLGGGASSLLKNPSDLYVGILQSRTIADHAINQFRLQQRWHVKTMVAARKMLASDAELEAEKSGLIQIAVSEHDPKLASDLANFYMDALYQMNSTLAMTEAAQRRLFFEQEVKEEKDALASAEEDLKKTQQKTGLLTVNAQLELAVSNIAQTQAEIASREVELQGMRSYASEQNPDVERKEQELQALQAHLSSLENSQQVLVPGDTGVATSQMPSGELEYLRKLREVQYHNMLFELISRQYEAARIDEAKSAPVIQVVDRAIPPDQKSGPPRLLITLAATILGFCFSTAYILALDGLERAKQNKQFLDKFSRLKGAIRRRKS